jgi:ABC-type lipoprotein release transport system permease subunit
MHTNFFVPLLRQMRYQYAVCLLLTLSLTGVVALYTYTRTSARFQTRSMQLIMKNMGHNLWFIHRNATPFLAATGSVDLPVFPVDRTQNLIADRQIASTYWAILLQAPATVRGRTLLLSGVAVLDDHQVTEEKDHLLAPLASGTAALGYSLARAWDMDAGDTLVLGENRSYQIQQVYPPRSTLDDERLWIPLADAQEWLDQPDRINVILGFLCMQGRSLEEGITRLENRLAERHGELQLLPQMNVLNARALSRVTTSSYLEFLLIAVASVTALLLAALGWMEVNDRKHELAILMAMGAGYRFLFLFFLTKLAILGTVGVLAGFLLGSFASVHWLSEVLITHTQPVAVLWSDLPRVLTLTLGLVGAASVAPLLHLLRLDPTRILAEE